MIGSDTGLVHAAEALGKNVIMIMGPTSKETGGGTIRKKSTVIDKKGKQIQLKNKGHVHQF